MTDFPATLGFARNRLARHSAEQPEETVPSPEAAGTRLLLLGGDRFLLDGGSALLDAAATLPGAAGRTETVFLGRWDGRPVFAAALPVEDLAPFERTGLRSVDLRSIATDGAVEPEELGLLAVASPC